MLTVILLTGLTALLYGSLFEWTLHKYFMHRPFLGIFHYPFEKHAQTHHRILRYDHSYHLQNGEDKHTIPMAWWNGPLLIAVATLPFLIGSVLVGTWAVALVGGAVIALYYGAYESLHWCMHLPRKRRVEKMRFFYRLNGHHLLHHRYPDQNLNVVLPVADLLLGTLLIRSPVRFKQAVGYMIPDLQPKEKAGEL